MTLGGSASFVVLEEGGKQITRVLPCFLLLAACTSKVKKRREKSNNWNFFLISVSFSEFTYFFFLLFSIIHSKNTLNCFVCLQATKVTKTKILFRYNFNQMNGKKLSLSTDVSYHVKFRLKVETLKLVFLSLLPLMVTRE